MEESRNKTNNILKGAIGVQGNTDNALYMNNQSKITQGSYVLQGNNQQMYMSVGPHIGKANNIGNIQVASNQNHQRHVSLSGNNRASSMSG